MTLPRQPFASAQTLMPDLTPGLSNKLIGEEYLDEGKTIAVDADERIVSLPFCLESMTAGEHEVTLDARSIKFTVEPRKKARLIGFKPLPLRERRPLNLGDSETCVFERIVIGKRNNAIRIDGINNKHPAATANAAPRGKTDKLLRAAKQQLQPTDWLAMLVSVGPDAHWIELSVFKGKPERIDLLYLADADKPVSLADRGVAQQNVIKSTFVAATDDSPSIAALALTRMGRWRAAGGGNAANQAIDDLGARLVQALSHADPRPRDAAWSALAATNVALRPNDIVALRKAGAPAHRACVALAARDLASASPAGRANMLTALNAAWRGADGELCSKIVAIVLKDAGPDAFDVLDGATREGLDEVFGRIKAETNPTLRAGLVRALIGQTPVEREQALMAEARQIRMEITNPNDGIFNRFKNANDPALRISILRTLCVMPATSVMHTDGFRGFVDFATSTKVDAAVRDSAFAMVIAQANANLPTHAQQPHGAFPFAARDGVLDGLSGGLAGAVEHGPPEVQANALAVMLLRGESLAAARALRAGKRVPDALAALLGKVTARPELIQSDGLFAFLIASATAVDRAATPVVLRVLDDVGKRYPEITRWRLAAALRAGADWPALIAASTSRDTAVSQTAMRWLCVAAHANAATQASLAKAGRAREREKALAAFNARLAENATGRYGCLIVMETTEQLDPVRFGASAEVRWSSPRRLNVFGPIVTLQRGEGSYEVAAGGAKVGGGKPLRVESVLPTAAIWPMALTTANWKVPGIERDKRGSPVPYSPLCITGGSVLAEGAEGALNIDAALIMQSALTNAESEIRATLLPLVPASLPITLRPTGFGSFAGVGASQPPSASAAKPMQLLNAMVTLEPLE